MAVESVDEATRREAASKTMRNYYTALTKALVKNDVPDHLYEEELIEDATHELLIGSSSATQQSKRKAYQDVLRAVQNNSDNFLKLCHVLKREEVGEKALSQSLQDTFTEKARELGTMNMTTNRFCSDFQHLKDQMNIYTKDLVEGILSMKIVRDVIHAAIENALKSNESIELLKDQMYSLCYKDLVIPTALREWAMQEVDEVYRNSSTSLPLAPLKAADKREKPSLFCKETLYHSSICCGAFGKTGNFGSCHLLQEVSMSLYQEEIGNTDSHIIARQDNTFYVAFQSEPTLSDWLKSPYQSFNEGLEVQMKQFPLRFLLQLLREQKKIVLTGFSFGGMLACYVAASLWKNSPVSGDDLESNVICITFGLPLVPMPYVQAIINDFPIFKSTMFSVFIKEDYFPCVLRYLQCKCASRHRKTMDSDLSDGQSSTLSSVLNFQDTFCRQFLHSLAKQENSYSDVLSPQASALPTTTEALAHLKTALKEIIPHAQENCNIPLGKCFVISITSSLEEGQGFVCQNPLSSENLAMLELGFLTSQAVEELGPNSFKKAMFKKQQHYFQHKMNEFQQAILKSYIDKEPDRYLPSRQPSKSKEISGVSILKPITTGVAFHIYPGEHVIVLNGENLSFCRKVRLGETLEVKIPSNDVTPRMIQLNLKPSGETKSLISKAGTVKVTLFSHFAKSITKKVPVTQEPFSFNLRQIQLAKYSPTGIISLALMSALLEQFPDHPAPNPSSKRFNVIANFLEEVVTVVPVESILWSIASSNDYTAVECANALIASRTKIPMTYLGSVVAAERAVVRLRTGAVASVTDAIVDIALKTCAYYVPTLVRNVPLQSISISAPTQTDVAVTGFGHILNRHSYSDIAKMGPQIPLAPLFNIVSRIGGFQQPTHSDIANKLDRIVTKSKTQFLPKDGYCGLNIECMYPVNEEKRFCLSPSTLQSPIKVLRDARESIASFVQDSHQNPEPYQQSGSSLPSNDAILLLVKEIYEQKMTICTSLLGAFMEQQIRIPLIKSEMDTASALEESSSPVAIGVWALFNVNHEELKKMLSSMGNTRLMVEIRDYIAGVLSDDLKSSESPGQNSRYNAKLQFLLQGIKSTVSCSSQYISYSLERQLSENLSKNSKFNESYTLKELVKKWSIIFEGDALSLVATSHRPLIARWLKWALLIHKLRETLAKNTCVGVTGLINSGKSQLVSKLFGVQTMVGTTERKRTTIPLLYNLDGKVKGLDVIDFPGVDDKDHSLPELAGLLLGLIQVVIFVVDHKRISSDVVKSWLRFLEDKHVPVIVCMTHADLLYTEFMAEEEGQPPEPTPFKSRQFQIDRQEKEKIVCPHPSRTLHYCCFYRPAGYMEELNIENFKKVGIKSPQDIGDELVKIFRYKLDQKSLADRLSEFFHKNDNQETKKQSHTALSPKHVPKKSSPNSVNGTVKLVSSTGARYVPPQKQPMAQPKPERKRTDSVSLPQMTSDCKLASGDYHAISATSSWNLEDVHSKLQLDGRDITIAVLDTGINLQHQVFETARKEGRICFENFLPQDVWKSDSHGSMAAFVASGKGFLPPSESIPIPSGVAPGASLFICQVAKDRLYCYLPLISALEKLLKLKKSGTCIDIITMSLGSEYNSDSDEQSKIRELIKELQKEEVVCIAACGNYGNYTDVLFPACLDSVISVGTLNRSGWRSEFNSPKDIDVYAPGEGIASPSIESNNGVEYHTGSSCAAPAIAGLVALLLQYANNHIAEDKQKKKFRDSLFLRKEILGKAMKKRGKADLLEPREYFMQRPELQSLLATEPMEVDH